MNSIRCFVGVFAMGAISFCASNAVAAEPLGTSFIYQGQLAQNGTPVDDTADFRISLWDAPAAGSQLGSSVFIANVDIENGLFSVALNTNGEYGPDAFNGEARYLAISVRSPAGSGLFENLSPRQPVSAAPYALQTRGLFVSDDGNLGVGTTSPFAKISVENSDPNSLGMAVNYNGPSGNAGIFSNNGASNDETALTAIHAGTGKSFLAYNYGTGIAGRIEIDNPANPESALHVRTNGTGPAAHIEGRVGIGTNDPDSELTVVGSIESTSGGFKFPDGSVQTTAATGTGGPSRTPQQIAQLRWYDTNTSGAQFGVGSFPFGIAFDGDHVWVTNLTSFDVTKIRTSDGQEAPGSPYPCNAAPSGIAYDGEHMWIANTLNVGNSHKNPSV